MKKQTNYLKLYQTVAQNYAKLSEENLALQKEFKKRRQSDRLSESRLLQAQVH